MGKKNNIYIYIYIYIYIVDMYSAYLRDIAYIASHSIRRYFFFDSQTSVSASRYWPDKSVW